MCRFSLYLLTLCFVVEYLHAAQPDVDFSVEKNVMVPMRDGVRLATDIYYPIGGGEKSQGKLPAVLLRSPYDKTADFVLPKVKYFARHGYISVVQDCRGRFKSEGKYFPYHETEDGHDTVVWLSKHPACNGRVGMHGVSAVAWSQFAAAAGAPPGLVTIIPRQGPTNLYKQLMRTGGARHLSMLHLIMQLAADSPRQKDPKAAGLLTKQMTGPAFLKWAYDIPWERGKTPLAKFPDYEDAAFSLYFSNHNYSPFWRQPTMANDLHMESKPGIPILWVTSWCDWNLGNNTGGFEKLVAAGHQGQHLIVGPWPHGVFRPYAGEVHFGEAGATIRDDKSFWQLELVWFDRWLKGKKNVSLGPRVRYFLMGGGSGRRRKDGRIDHGGKWESDSSWPPMGVKNTRYYLRNGGRLSTEPPPNESGFTRYRYDPRKTACSIGRAWVPVGPVNPGEFMPGPRDQIEVETLKGHWEKGRRITDRTDVISFQTSPLTSDLKLVGNMNISLTISSDAPDTDFYVRVLDVHPPNKDYPRGFSFPMSEGMLRARYRNSLEKPELMKVGRRYRLQIPLQPTANRVKAGHRIQVYICSSNFPVFDVNFNNADLNNHTPRVASNTVFHEKGNASFIQLPVMSAPGSDRTRR